MQEALAGPTIGISRAATMTTAKTNETSLLRVLTKIVLLLKFFF